MKRTERDLITNTPRNLRLDAGMSAKDVCELTGWDAPRQSTFERRHTNPRAVTLALFLAAVGRDDLLSFLTPLIGASEMSAVLRVQAARESVYDLKGWAPAVPIPS